jgi:hypothetical protein
MLLAVQLSCCNKRWRPESPAHLIIALLVCSSQPLLVLFSCCTQLLPLPPHLRANISNTPIGRACRTTCMVPRAFLAPRFWAPVDQACPLC